jgi:hypothetical protein
MHQDPLQFLSTAEDLGPRDIASCMITDKRKRSRGLDCCTTRVKSAHVCVLVVKVTFLNFEFPLFVLYKRLEESRK